MLKMLLPVTLIFISLLALAWFLSRWLAGKRSPLSPALQILCIGCVAAGLVALTLFST